VANAGDIARALSPRAEFGIVAVLAFGWFCIGSLHAVLQMADTGVAQALGEPHVTGRGLQRLVVYELIVGGALVWMLVQRGWTRLKVGLQPNWADVGLGVVLVGATYLAVGVLSLVVQAFAPSLAEVAMHARLVGGGISLATILVASAVNAVYEEVFVAGYLVTFLKEHRGLWFAVNTSAAVRLTYHLYQGPIALVGVLPLALGFAYLYARSGRLWPLVVSHFIIDVIGVLAHQ